MSVLHVVKLYKKTLSSVNQQVFYYQTYCLSVVPGAACSNELYNKSAGHLELI